MNIIRKALMIREIRRMWDMLDLGEEGMAVQYSAQKHYSPREFNVVLTGYTIANMKDTKSTATERDAMKEIARRRKECRRLAKRNSLWK